MRASESIVTGGSGFGQSAEAQLVATLLRVAVNRDDSEALYQALASRSVRAFRRCSSRARHNGRLGVGKRRRRRR